MPEITLRTLIYTKADLEQVPSPERLFFLMAASAANDTQMLNKALAVILAEQESGYRLVNQGNAAFGMMILRMLTGRLNEAWKLVSKHSNMIKSEYEAALSGDARSAFRRILAYFGGRRSLILAVRDGVAFHHLPEHVETAYASLPMDADIGDYLHERIGNTLFYTTEILQYESLKNLAKTSDHIEALRLLISDVREQTTNFNTFIFGFTKVFAERHLPSALERLRQEPETIEAPTFAELRLPYFSILPDADC